MFIGVPKSQLIQSPALVCRHGNSRVEIAFPSRTRSSTPRLHGAVEIGCQGCERKCKANAISQLADLAHGGCVDASAPTRCRTRLGTRCMTVGGHRRRLYSTQVRVQCRKG